MTSRDVPTADFIGTRPRMTSAGTMRNPPPMRVTPVCIPTRHPAIMLSIGFCVGLLTGVIGIGGGFLIVPALVILGRVPMKSAVGTSLLVIAMNSLSGYLGYHGREIVPWDFVVRFSAVAVVGILAGTALVRHISTR